MASFVAVYDACVLYPAPLRDLLLRLALTDLFRARWTERIHEEWMRSVLKDRSDLSAQQIQRTRELMDLSVPDCLVTGYEGLIENLDLPDPNDRHVLAAAIRCQAGVIVTYNLTVFRKPRSPVTVSMRSTDDLSRTFTISPRRRFAPRSATARGAEESSAVGARVVGHVLSLGLAGTVARLESMQELL